MKAGPKRLAVLLGLLVIVWLGSSLFVADELTRRARRPYAEPVPVLPCRSSEAFRLSTSDGHELGAWFFSGAPGRPVVLLLHGNGGDRTSCLPQAVPIVEEGHSVLLVTMRAHGDSTGDRNDFGRSARHDVRAAVDWLAANHPDRPVVVWGRSLGSAAALFASADLGSRVHGYILECPFLDLPTAVRNRTRLHLPPVVEAVAYTGLSLTAPLVLTDPDGISPVVAAGGVAPGTPVLVLAGGADWFARPDEARAIADRIGENARLVVFENGGHLALEHAEPDRYRSVVYGFLSDVRLKR